ncbi:MAG: valine--tRNA ligase, partial [Clostridiales bacterium]|nr:valine--tRNA ligase [Clostridiales bacterium]
DGGVMNENAGVYKGLDRAEARKKIVEDLTAGGYLVKIEPYSHNVGGCYRCGTNVEPIVSKQWFVNMKPLAEPAIEAVKKGKIRFVPKRFEKIYFNWMENVKDWCISRQLWWGHRIPAYYCSACGETVVSKTAPDVCPVCGATRFKQDEDVLDTWFSSGLWTFSTLGYPAKTPELDYFYPTNLLITAYDIIFFWVARMIFSGLEFMGEVPFSEVLIHGIVRDDKGRKMSKSLGNGIDPLDIIEKYGADALRFSLSFGIAPGSDTRFAEEKIESSRNFMNKLWNAARFVDMNRNGASAEIPKAPDFADKWILTKLNQVVRGVTVNINRYEIGLAATKLYDFVWSDFCDWYIEAKKPMLYGGDSKAKTRAASMLTYVLTEILKLIHPFAPFITEEIYGILSGGGILMLQEWPKYNKANVYGKETKIFDGLKDIVAAIRNIRAEMGVPAAKKVKAYVVSPENAAFLKKADAYLAKLAGLSETEYLTDKLAVSDKSAVAVTSIAEVFIPLGDLIDIDKEIARLVKERDAAEAEVARSENMLANQGFLIKAPSKLVDAEKEKLVKNRDKLAKILERIEFLK